MTSKKFSFLSLTKPHYWIMQNIWVEEDFILLQKIFQLLIIELFLLSTRQLFVMMKLLLLLFKNFHFFLLSCYCNEREKEIRFSFSVELTPEASK